jgi:hypothetical protein
MKHFNINFTLINSQIVLNLAILYTIRVLSQMFAKNRIDINLSNDTFYKSQHYNSIVMI